MQMSGYLMEIGIHFGNLHETALKEIIQSGTYLDNICATVGDLREKTKKCAECRYFEQCTGGCRALGLLYSGKRKDFCGEDITKCMFFENGWYEKSNRNSFRVENTSYYKLIRKKMLYYESYNEQKRK